MTSQIRLLVLVPIVGILAFACAQKGGGGALAGGKNGTIVLYRAKGSDACKSITTPYLKKNKGGGNVQWKVDDDFDCQSSSDVIELKFADDPLPDCVKKTSAGGKNITCSLADAEPTGGTARKYTVWLNSTQIEDPELEIGQ